MIVQIRHKLEELVHRFFLPSIATIRMLGTPSSGELIVQGKAGRESNGRPTVAIVTNVYYPMFGGISTYVENLEKGLNEKGYDVSVIAFPASFIRTEEAIANKVVHRFVHEFFVFAFTISTLWKILRLRFRGKHLIAHSQSASFCMSIGVLSKLLGARAVHTFHSPIKKCSILLRTQIPFLDETVYVSEEQMTEYSTVCRTRGAASIVPGGVDCSFYTPPKAEERSSARERLAEKTGTKKVPSSIIAYVGRVVKEKGVNAFFEAAQTILKSKPDTTFIVQGPLDQTKAQIAYIEDLRRRAEGLNFFIFGKEDAEGVRDIYRASDIVVCPSLLEEASPMVIVESMAMGVPVIASRIGGLKSRIEDGLSGYFIEPGDVKGLTVRILELLDNPLKINEMGKRSRALAVQKYSIESMLTRYEEVYRKVIARRHDA